MSTADLWLRHPSFKQKIGWLISQKHHLTGADIFLKIFASRFNEIKYCKLCSFRAYFTDVKAYLRRAFLDGKIFD